MFTNMFEEVSPDILERFGYVSMVVGVGGAAGCEGAIWLHSWYLSLCSIMQGVIPGQNTVPSALESMEVTPW